MTVFAAFPRERRFLCPQAVLLIHERRLEKDVVLKGPIRSSLQIIREQLALLETAERIEDEGFRDLIRGSNMSLDNLRERAMSNCYMMADKALEQALVAAVVE